MTTTTTSAATAQPSAPLTQFALRVALTITKPQLTAKDTKATLDAEAANKAHGAGQYRKDLYPKHLIAPISEVESRARAFIAKNTITNILPTARFMWFADELGKMEIAFNQAVTVFLNNYAEVLNQAQQTQGDLFDLRLYPDMASLRSEFTWQVKYFPVADTSAFAQLIAPMEQAAAAQLTAAVAAQVQAEQETLVGDAVSRLKDTVAHLAELTSRPDRMVISKVHGGVEARPPVFRQSVVDNITELTEMLASYANALPPEVLDLMKRAQDLTVANAETLKNDPDVRKDVQVASVALLSEIDALMGNAPPPPVAAPLPTGATPVIPGITDALDDDFAKIFGVNTGGTITAPVFTPDAAVPVAAPEPTPDAAASLADALKEFY